MDAIACVICGLAGFYFRNRWYHLSRRVSDSIQISSRYRSGLDSCNGPYRTGRAHVIFDRCHSLNGTGGVSSARSIWSVKRSGIRSCSDSYNGWGCRSGIDLFLLLQVSPHELPAATDFAGHHQYFGCSRICGHESSNTFRYCSRSDDSSRPRLRGQANKPGESRVRQLYDTS